MEKHNDWLASMFFQPDMNIQDLADMGVTTENSELKSRDFYKNQSAIKEAFTEEGKFNEKSFNAYYDSVERIYNKAAEYELVGNILNQKTYDERDHMAPINGRIRDYSPEIIEFANPLAVSRSAEGVNLLSDPTLSIREAAQNANVFNIETGEFEDYTPNDLNVLSFWTAPNLILAKDGNGNLKFNEEGSPYYETLGGRSAVGQDLLHVSDILTTDGSAWNQYDFFDSDGLDKSAFGTVMKTAVSIAPYLIPGVGQYVAMFEIGRSLVESLPELYKGVSSLAGSDLGFSTANEIAAFASRFNSSVSDAGAQKLLSFESIGNMAVDSIKQLYAQRTLWKGIQKLIPADSPEAIKKAKNLSLSYMAITSTTQSYEQFKQAGASDFMAGLGAVGTMLGTWKLMTTDYFRNYALGDELERNTLLPGVKGAADEFANVFNYKTAQLPKKKAAEFINKVANYVTKEGVVQGALNESVEEVMEEGVADMIKGVSLALNKLGLADSNKTYDFGFSGKDFLSRYGTAFVGGAIGGAVFSTHDIVERRLSGKTDDITPSGISDLVFYLRTGNGDKLRKIAKELRDKGKLGSTSLSTEILRIENNNGEEQVVYKPATSSEDSQNEAVYKYLLDRFDTIETLLKKENLLITDTFLKALVSNPDFDFDQLGQEELKAQAQLFAEQSMETALQGGLASRVVNDFQSIAEKLVATELKMRRLLTPAVDESSDNKAIEAKIESVKKSSEYMELETELKTLREKRDEILTGKRNGYYLEQGLFVGSYDFAHMFNIPLNVKSYTKLNYDKNYDDLSDDKKKSLDEEFRVYLNKEGKESIYYAFELFRNLSEKTKELVEKQGSRFESFREYFRGSELFGANWQVYRQDLLSAKEHAEKQSKEGPEELRAGYQAQVDDINESLSKYPESLVFAPIYNVTRTTKNIVQVPTKNNGETDAQFITRLNAYLDEVSAYVSSIKKADGFIESGDLTIEALFDALHQFAEINPSIKSELDVVNEYYVQRRWDELARHINESGLDMLGEEDPILGRFITTVEEVAQTMSTLETNPALVLMQNILSNLEKDPVAYSHLLNVLSLAERTSDPTVLEINDDQTLNSLKQIDSLLPIAYAIVKSAISGGYNTIINRINKNNIYAELNEDSGLEFQDDIQALKNKLDYILDVVEKNRLSKVTVQQNLYYHIAPLIFKQIRDFDLEKLQNAFEDAFSEQGSLKELIKKYNIPESLEAKTPEAFGKYYQQVCLFESEFRQRIISTYTMDQVAEKLESIYGQAAASEPNMHFSTDAKAVKSEDMLLYLASIINSDSVEFHKKVWEAIADKRFEKAVLFPQLYDVRILYAQMWNPDAIQFFNKILEIFKANGYNKFAESFTTEEELAKGEISSETKYLQSRFILSNFTSPIRGSAGTGKTGGVFALTVSLLDNVEYVGLVPSKGQVKSLKNSTGAKTVFTKEQFFKKLGINNVDYIAELNVAATATEEQKELVGKASDIFSGEYKMIVLDEFSLFSSAELELISTYAKTHGIIVVSAGDFKQNKKTLKHEHNGKYYVHSIDDCVTLNTPELLASLRASNVAKLMNATQLENVLLPVYDKLKENPTMSAAEISAELEAIRINFVYTRNEKGAVIAGEKLVHVDSNKSVLYDEIDKLLEAIPSDLEESVCVITDDKEFYSKYADDKRIVVMNTEESQGQEYDYVVLDISKEDAGYSSNTFMMLSSYYTAIERSRKATLIAHYPKNKVQFADSEYSRGANAIETDGKFIADMMDFYNKAFNWVNSVDDPDYEDSWYNEESEDDSDDSDDSEDDDSGEDSGEESVDDSETEDDEDDSKKPKGKKKTTPRKKPTPKKVKRTSTKTTNPKKTPVKRTTKKTSAGTSIGTYKPSANAAKLPIRINIEKIRTLLGTDKEFSIKFAINSLPKKSSIKAFLASSDANYYYGALYWACVRESLPDNWKSVFKPYGDDAIITLLESVANKDYSVKTIKHNGEEINIITCSLLDTAGDVLVTIPITCVDNKPTKAQLQRIKGWKISTDIIAFDNFVSLSDIPPHLHKSKIMVLNAAKLSGNKDTFARMNNGGAFMYVSEDIFESVESPTIFEVDSSGHTTSLWESNAHGGLIAVNDVRSLSELGSKIQAKHIAHSAINAALRCANDSEDGDYFANLFLEQLYKRLSRSNKKSQKIILECTTISSGEIVSAELTVKDSTISLKTGNRKSITWNIGDSTNSSEIFAELNSIFKTDGAERYTYRTVVDKKENFYVIADALEQTFKEGRKHKKLKSVSKLKINASIATQNVHVQDVWNNIDRKNSFSYNATIYTIAAPILGRSESSEETKEEVKPQPKKKTKVKPEITDVLKKVVAELNLFGTTPNQLTTDGTWYLYDAGGLLSVNQSTGKYNYNPNTILPEGVTVNDVVDLFASEEILGEYLDNGGDDSIAELIENLKKDDNTQNCSM